MHRKKRWGNRCRASFWEDAELGSFAGRWRWLGFGCGVTGLGPARSPAAGTPETATVHGRRSGNPPKKTMKGPKWDGCPGGGRVAPTRSSTRGNRSAIGRSSGQSETVALKSFFLSFLSFISQKCVPRVSPSVASVTKDRNWLPDNYRQQLQLFGTFDEIRNFFKKYFLKKFDRVTRKFDGRKTDFRRKFTKSFIIRQKLSNGG